MARPKKTGLDYFSVDTDRFQDLKIKRLKKAFGCNGFAVYDYLLNEIYRVKGCFLEWDDCTAFDVADYWGLKENVVKEIVRYCGAVGLFDKELLSGGIITSASIQGRYLYMCEKSKRKDFLIPEFIRLIPEETKFTPEETPFTPEVIPQNKIKESILKEKVEKEKPKPPPSFQEIIQDFFENNSMHLDQARIAHEDFFALAPLVLSQWELAGWNRAFIKPGAGDFSALKFIRWIQTEKRHQYETSQKTRLQNRRGVDTAARSPDDYDGSF